MAESELDNRFQSLPIVEGPLPGSNTIDTIMLGYLDESLKDTNPELHERIHNTLHDVYKQLDTSRNLNAFTDEDGHLILSRDQFHSAIAFALLRGALVGLIEVAEPLRAARELEEQFIETT